MYSAVNIKLYNIWSDSKRADNYDILVIDSGLMLHKHSRDR